MSESRLTDALITFGVGLMAGVAVGALLAPKSGRESRKDIEKLAGRMGLATRKESEKARDFLADQVKRVERALAEGKQAYKSGAPKPMETTSS